MENPIWGIGIFGKRKQAEDILSVLKQVPIFSELSPRELAEVEKIVHRRKYKKGEAVIRAGDPGLGMYIIHKGAVDIVEESEEKGRKFLAHLSDGAFFGDLALLDESPRSATAIASDESQVIGFFRPDFIDLLNRKPKLGIKVLLALARVIGERLRRTNELLAKVRGEKEVSSDG